VKSDLDGLMAERGFDAFVVMGGASGNPALAYLTNGAKVTHGYALKRRGRPPVLVVNAMERGEAAKSGLPVVTDDAFEFLQLFRETGSLFEAELRLFERMFDHFSVEGTVCFYGVADPGRSYRLLTRLDATLPAVTVTGETDSTIFDEATMTKDADEIAALRSVAGRTNAVFDEVINFLRGHAVADDRLVVDGGAPLTVGAVKRFLRGRLYEYGLEDEGVTIFAVGHDSGVPHSRGEADDVLPLGTTIVFDLFPRDLESGYYHDMTRTFCLGYAPPEVQRTYETVMQAFDAVMDRLAVGEEGGLFQDITCDVFEEHGHPTIRSTSGTQVGYVHNLGHGVGLRIHERPRLAAMSTDRIAPGQVFTVEPGLYYPDEGYGVRVEDTLYVDEAGRVISLTPYPKDLVISVGEHA
jgi:Xaa-Pro aminopeptidase